MEGILECVFVKSEGDFDQICQKASWTGGTHDLIIDF